jgi:hypothetical protein
MVKKFSAVLLAAILITSPVYAGEVVLNDVPIGVNIDIMEKDGHIYVPLRALANMVGAKLSWEDKTKTVTVFNPFTIEETVLTKVTIGKKTAIVYPVDEKGKQLGTTVQAELDAVPLIINSLTYIPLNFIMGNLGYEGGYDKASGNIYLKG